MELSMTYERDWDCDGAIRMKNAKTIDRYRELKEQHPDCKECDCFFAFGRRQFKDGLNSIRPLKESEKLQDAGGGLFGTKDGLVKFSSFYEDRDKLIKAECSPQEVYFHEYNNYECMIAYNGDTEAIKIIIDYWGVDIAKTITRFSDCKSIEKIIAEINGIKDK